MLERSLKLTLERLVAHLYGPDAPTRWVPAYFPFTHPSWELEIQWGGQWVELLGCGIMEQQLLCNSGAGSRVGWAFGLGLERLAMPLFGIDDIRLFWSEDPAFTRQFADARHDAPDFPPKFVPFPTHPPASYDVSFWVVDAGKAEVEVSDVGDAERVGGANASPLGSGCAADASGSLSNAGAAVLKPVSENVENTAQPAVMDSSNLENSGSAEISKLTEPSSTPVSQTSATPPVSLSNSNDSVAAEGEESSETVKAIKSDFADLARSIVGDPLEEVTLLDEFRHPKTGKVSLCYRILYRDPVKPLPREESLQLHEKLVEGIRDELGVEIR